MHIDEERQIYTIHTNDLLKYRVSAASQIDANEKAASLSLVALSCLDT